jgi:hypothetical protein
MLNLNQNFINAIKISIKLICIICGLSGLVHGLFEILQGNQVIEMHTIAGKQMIYAIGKSNRFWEFGYAPAYTIIPNYLISGIIAMIFSASIIIYAIKFIEYRFTWIVLLLLSILQYISGGGAAQFGCAIIISIYALFINSPLKLLRKIPNKVRKFISKPWLILLIIFLIVFLHSIITEVFGFLYGVRDPNIITKSLFIMLYIMVTILPLLIISTLSYNSVKMEEIK